jgi:hypothetical protein
MPLKLPFKKKFSVHFSLINEKMGKKLINGWNFGFKMIISLLDLKV